MSFPLLPSSSMLPSSATWRCGNTISKRCLQRYKAVQAAATSPLERHCSSDAKASPRIIFSGIQPTGVPHLGNFLGALRQWVKFQNDAETDTRLIYSLVDLHAITIRQTPQKLREQKQQSLATLLAIGLDPKRSIIFHQSDVPAHSELMWILSCQASTGYLSRMTQWKDKTSDSRENSERLKLGLFSYPVLQAADVLVHRTTHVPVGHDQAQHLEFAREVAIGFNSVFGEDVLVPPETLISPAKRVMSLNDPTVKMSKSHPLPKSRILLTDSDKEIKSKINAAVTDSEYSFSYDPEKRPGVSNLFELLYHMTADEHHMAMGEFQDDFRGVMMPAFKAKVIEGVQTTLKPIRERYEEIMSQPQVLDEVARDGAVKATESANRTLTDVKRAVGLL